MNLYEYIEWDCCLDIIIFFDIFTLVIHKFF